MGLRPGPGLGLGLRTNERWSEGPGDPGRIERVTEEPRSIAIGRGGRLELAEWSVQGSAGCGELVELVDEVGEYLKERVVGHALDVHFASSGPGGRPEGAGTKLCECEPNSNNGRRTWIADKSSASPPKSFVSSSTSSPSEKSSASITTVWGACCGDWYGGG